MKKDLNDMLSELLEVWNSYHKQGTHPWTREVAAQDLQYQIWSFAKLVLQLQNFRYREWLSEDEIKKKMADELADILAEVIFVADGYQIDLPQAWQDMLVSDRKKISERSWKSDM